MISIYKSVETISVLICDLRMFQFSDLSRYRSSLMGIGILGVMLAHYLSWANTASIIPTAYFRPFTGLVFTEGFLLLSGLGLFYSWQKNSNTKSFYKKRIYRLFIPYMLISFAFIAYSAIISCSPLLDSILRLLTLKFWIFGNDSMWYISVSLALYLAFPFIYQFLFNGKFSFKVKSLIIIFLWISICYIIHILFTGYYKSVELGFPKIWMFFLGMLLGKYAYSNTRTSKMHIALFCCIVVMAVLSNLSDNNFIKPLGDCLLRLVTIPIVCILFNITQKWNSFVHNILSWFGKYSLELYIIHLLVYESIKFSYKFFNSISYTSYSRIGGTISIILAISTCSIVHNGINRLLKRQLV